MNARTYQIYVVVKWEMLRVPYILVLLCPGLIMPAEIKNYVAAHFGPGYWAAYLLCMAVANVFFCLGPLSEAYLFALWGKQVYRGSLVLYGLGSVFSFLWMGGYELLIGLPA